MPIELLFIPQAQFPLPKPVNSPENCSYRTKTTCGLSKSKTSSSSSQEQLSYTPVSLWLWSWTLNPSLYIGKPSLVLTSFWSTPLSSQPEENLESHPHPIIDLILWYKAVAGKLGSKEQRWSSNGQPIVPISLLLRLMSLTWGGYNQEGGGQGRMEM